MLPAGAVRGPRFARALGVGPGVTALIGGGGKTSLMERLARELASEGRVILTTSTHIRVPDWLPVLEGRDPGEAEAALDRTGLICLGLAAEPGKLGPPGLPFQALAALADYVLVEADGSRGLPLKAHLAHEPVIPPEAGRVLAVAGADGFGRPISQVCHRPERFARLAETDPEAPATPEALARVLEKEGLGDLLYVNKAESPAALEAARALAKLCSLPVWAGSLWREELECLS